MKLKEIITNVFTSKAKKAEAKRIAEEAEAQKQAKEAEARRKAEAKKQAEEAAARRKAEAKKQAEEAAARKKVEEEEAKRKAFLDKPYETLMPMVMKSLETTGKMTSQEISSLLQLDKLGDRGDLVALGFIDGNFVLKTQGLTTDNFYVIKNNHVLAISTEYLPERTEKIFVRGTGYYSFYRDHYEDHHLHAQHSLSLALDNKKIYEDIIHDDTKGNYAKLSKHLDTDSNLKILFDKITFPGRDIKSKMTNPKDISRQEEIEQQLSQSLTKYKNKQEEKALEDKKQKELEKIAREKAVATENLKAQNDRLEQNPALNVFLSSKTGHGK